MVCYTISPSGPLSQVEITDPLKMPHAFDLLSEAVFQIGTRIVCEK